MNRRKSRGTATVAAGVRVGLARGSVHVGMGLAAGLSLLLIGPAHAADEVSAADNAQTAPSPAETSVSEVVVTGTRLRHAGPVGSTLIDLDQTQIQQSGANSISDALRTLPQVDNLGVTEGTRGGTGGAGNIVYGNSINLRGLSPFATLTLLNGHRVPPSGTTGATVDPDSFPSLLIQRVDVVADGASATYGSDAVAGVVNLIMRRNVEGFEAQARYGGANHYEENRLGAALGHSWESPLGTGQISIGFEQNYHSSLNGQNRSYFQSDQRSSGGANYASLQCNPGTISIGNTNYAIPKGGVTPATASSLVPGTANYCDPAKYQDILPRVRHDNAAFTFDQQLGDRVSVFADGTYAKRTFTFRSAAPAGPLQVPSSNAFFVAPPGTNPTAETVNYSFANDLGPYSYDVGSSISVQGTLGLKVQLGHDWVFQVDGTAGRDNDHVYDPPNAQVNGNLGAALASGDPAKALNVYGGNNSPSVIQNIFSGIFYGPGFSREQVIEGQVDGPLLTLPGGAMRLALGGQWRHDELLYGINSGAPPQELVLRERLHRHSNSAFAELLVPIVGDGNALPGIRHLDLDIAGRYEDYSDFGSTSHPKIGLNWSPVENVQVHASYGTSFRAPLLSELVGPLRGTFVQTYSDPLAPGGTSVGYTLGGGNTALKPETATTYSFGVDVEPIEHAKISLTYYNINYRNQIASYLSDLTILQQANQLGSLITRCPSAACSALVQQYVTGPNALPLFGPPLANPSVFVNGAEQNLGRTKTQGLDFVGNYSFHTPLPGLWSVGVSGNVTTQYDVQYTPGGAFFDALNTIGYPMRLRMRGNLGWSLGPWATTLFVNYANGYTNNEITPSQSVKSFTTADVDAAYDFGQAFPGTWTRDLTLTVHVNNIGNSTPPYVNVPIGNSGGGFDPGAASPIGRLISVAIGKKF
jgi:iron complex outermembrane recepter protein